MQAAKCNLYHILHKYIYTVRFTTPAITRNNFSLFALFPFLSFFPFLTLALLSLLLGVRSETLSHHHSLPPSLYLWTSSIRKCSGNCAWLAVWRRRSDLSKTGSSATRKVVFTLDYCLLGHYTKLSCIHNSQLLSFDCGPLTSVNSQQGI